MQHRGCRDRGVGPGFPLRRGVGVGQRHGPLERGEGALVPFRPRRLAEPGQGRRPFEHRQLAALLLLLVGRLEDPVVVPLASAARAVSRGDRLASAAGGAILRSIRDSISARGSLTSAGSSFRARCRASSAVISLLVSSCWRNRSANSCWTCSIFRASWRAASAAIRSRSCFSRSCSWARARSEAVFDLLPPADVTDRPQRGDAHDRDDDEPAPQPAAGDGHLLVDLLELLLEPLHLESQAADLLVELLGRGRGVVVPAGRGQALAVGLLQLPELGGLGLVRVGREAVAGQEDVDRLAQLDGDVVFELRVAPPGRVGGPLPRFGPVAVPGDVDHGVARVDPLAELVDQVAVIGREVVLLDGVIVVVLEPLLDELAHRAQLAGDRADEDAGVAPDRPGGNAHRRLRAPRSWPTTTY